MTVTDDETFLLPDWQGSDRIDSLRNILRDGRVSLIFLIPGSTTAIRINGTARLTSDELLRARFTRDGNDPRTVALLHKSADGRGPPFPGQTYATVSVMGMPSAVKPFRTATRI